MTNCIGDVYIENDIKLLWLIRSSVDYYENWVGQLRD